MSNRYMRSLLLVALATGFVTVAGCASTPHKESTGEYFDDSAITTKVKAAIFNDPGLSAAEINVETFKGKVQLSGFVNSQEKIDRAVSVARSVNGVQSVHNKISLKQAP
ncbi:MULTISPECIES: BON domain-containing protein [Microvirgula]|nr:MULTISPECIES: BON domain-containing protein [Microvirgula]RAS17186.1 BON domain-containing protein [Microvirgula sp. AG722]